MKKKWMWISASGLTLILLVVLGATINWGVPIGLIIAIPLAVLVWRWGKKNRERRDRETSLKIGEEILWQERPRFLGIPVQGQTVIITTERLIRPDVMRRPSIPFSEIYMTNQASSSIAVGAYGSGLMIGTTLHSKYLELDLQDGSVIRIENKRPHVLQQRLFDAVAAWEYRQQAALEQQQQLP